MTRKYEDIDNESGSAQTANLPLNVWTTGGIAGYEMRGGSDEDGALPDALIYDIVRRYWAWRYDRVAERQNEPSALDLSNFLGLKTLDES